jgi:hypothetical protein
MSFSNFIMMLCRARMTEVCSVIQKCSMALGTSLSLACLTHLPRAVKAWTVRGEDVSKLVSILILSNSWRN